MFLAIVVARSPAPQGFVNRPQKLDRGQLAALELGIQRRCDDLISVGEDLKGIRAGTREAIQAGRLKLRERWRRNTREASEFNQFKQVVLYRRRLGQSGDL